MAMSVVYANVGGEILCENREGAVSYYATDCQGSTMALVDETGTVTDTYDYWSYGEERVHTGLSQSKRTFLGVLGYVKDILNKFYYIRARFLRPDLARWQTVDPVWPNQPAYEYVSAAPVNYSDPTGLDPVSGGIIGGLTGGLGGWIRHENPACRGLIGAAVGAIVGAITTTFPWWGKCLVGAAAGLINSLAAQLCRKDPCAPINMGCVIVNLLLGLLFGCGLAWAGTGDPPPVVTAIINTLKPYFGGLSSSIGALCGDWL